jgi:hypothetical protein
MFFKNAKKQDKIFTNLNFSKKKVLISYLANLIFASRPEPPLTSPYLPPPPKGLWQVL